MNALAELAYRAHTGRIQDACRPIQDAYRTYTGRVQDPYRTSRRRTCPEALTLFPDSERKELSLPIAEAKLWRNLQHLQTTADFIDRIDILV
ncbi:hypothetical protein ElyMa_005706500 [Elysia marginata]|uniref:Transposase n=1 Tax=Elysia marginata TaxID=1093978 RepID=A0AAV4FHE4_9GAST|nr:hypothetical protein ElyMa_005706500 [Elysia marginata]